MTQAPSAAPRTAGAAVRATAVGLVVLSAFLWATYYLFVLWATPAATPSSILVVPFLVGGSAYLGLATARGAGRTFLRLFLAPSAYVRILLLIGMQVSVLAATYLTGPVDSSLLSLIGDVVATPIAAATLYGVHRRQLFSVLFAVGVGLNLVGGGLAIAGGQRLAAVPPLGWLIVPAIPLTVALYVLLTARANESLPQSAVVGQSMLGAGLVLVLLSPLLPGGAGTLFSPPPKALLLLVATGMTSFFGSPVLYFAAIGRVGLVLPPMLMTGIPVFTLLLSAVFLGLSPPLVALLGIPIAVAGGLVAIRAEAAAPSAAAPTSTL